MSILDSKYLYFVQMELDPKVWGETTSNLLPSAVQRHKRAAQKPRYAVYRSLTGSRSSLYGLVGMNSLAEVDAWPKLEEVKNGQSGWTRCDRILLAARPELSNRTEAEGSPAYIYLVESVPGSTGDRNDLQRIAEAYRRHDDAPAFATFIKVAGEGGPAVYTLYGVDSMASIERWPSQREVIGGAYGDEEATRLLSPDGNSGIQRTLLLQYLPDFSTDFLAA
jgi:hypothetical protein